MRSEDDAFVRTAGLIQRKINQMVLGNGYQVPIETGLNANG